MTKRKPTIKRKSPHKKRRGFFRSIRSLFTKNSSSEKKILIKKKAPSRIPVLKKIVTTILLGLFFIFCAVLYFATIKGAPGNPGAKEIRSLDKATKPFELSPERGRYAHTYALAENGSFSLTPELAEAVYPDVGYVDGRFYSFFAPGLSFVAVPFYKLGSMVNLGQVATFSVISLFALGNLFFLYRISRDIFSLTNMSSLVAPVIFGFSSTAWSYATTMYQHHLTTFFILSGFYAVWKYRQQVKGSFLWAGYVWLAYALAFFVDYPNLVLVSPVMLYFLLSSVSIKRFYQRLSIHIRPAFILTSLVFFLIMGIHGYYNQTQLGSWKQLSGTIIGYKVIKERQLFQSEAGKQTIKEIEEAKTTTSFFSEQNLPNGFAILTVAPDKGLLFFSPIFLFGVIAILGLLKKMNMQLAVLMSLVGLNLFLYSSFGDPWGGWAFGPRYLIISMAILSLFIGLWLTTVRYRLLAKFMLFLLFAFSSAIALIGVLTTNAVPPQVEADFLKMKYGMFLAFDYFRDGGSSSFLYNTIFSRIFTLQQYFMLLYVPLITVFAIVLLRAKGQNHYDN